MHNHTHIASSKNTMSVMSLTALLGTSMLPGLMACHVGAGYSQTSSTTAVLQTTQTVHHIGDYEVSVSEDALCEAGRMRRVTGNVYIRDSAELESLSCLTEIEGDLKIWFNPELLSLQGLESLSRIGGDVYISFNPELLSLQGLESLSRIDGNVHIEGSASLSSLQGLESLSRIGGDVYITNNDQLTSLAGISALETINGALTVYANPALSSANDLLHIEVLDGIQLYDNPSMSRLTDGTSRADLAAERATANLIVSECSEALRISCSGVSASY